MHNGSKKIIMVLAHHGFRDEEYQIPRDIFEAAGCEVRVASNYSGEAAGSHGAVAKVDILAGHIHPADYNAIVIVGGPGVPVFYHDVDLFRILKEFAYEQKVVAAICSAPIVLAHAGLLSGRKATGFHSDAYQLESNGAYFTGHAVEKDGLTITAIGPDAAKEFAGSILEALGFHAQPADNAIAPEAGRRRL